MRVAMIGATGLVGSRAASTLMDRGWSVDAVLRRTAGLIRPQWREHVAHPAQWPGIASSLRAEAVVSALGTTIRQAGSKAAFRAVDLDMVIDFARAAAAAGARRMVAVSSVGADPGSANFYLRTKGEMERALTEIGFERLDILRPGLLLGERGAERRLGERVGIALSPIAAWCLRGSLDRFAAIDAGLVAAAIVGALLEDGAGSHVHENRGIRRLAGTDRPIGPKRD
jgi:uncharacterized protein YbjT (DUF2867 family)